MAAALACFARSGLSITIVNCFTESSYAPFSELVSAADVSRQRRREDEEFLRRLGGPVSLIDLGYPDAPLRLGIAPDEVCFYRPDRDPARGPLAASLLTALTAPQIFLPMGLGGHVDHVLARDETLTALAGRPCAFYEELPYAMRSADLDAEVSSILPAGYSSQEHKSGAKRHLIGAYGTQASAAELDRIGGRPERTWVPS